MTYLIIYLIGVVITSGIMLGLAAAENRRYSTDLGVIVLVGIFWALVMPIFIVAMITCAIAIKIKAKKND